MAKNKYGLSFVRISNLLREATGSEEGCSWVGQTKRQGAKNIEGKKQKRDLDAWRKPAGAKKKMGGS